MRRHTRRPALVFLAAVLGLGLAACGDDDTGDEDTAPTIADVVVDDQSSTPDDADANDADANDADADDADVDDTDVEDTETEDTDTDADDADGDEAAADVLADCQTVVGVLQTLDEVPEPVVGEAIPDEVASMADTLSEELHDLELTTDAGDEVRDRLENYFDDLVDGGEYTQEMDDSVGDENVFSACDDAMAATEGGAVTTATGG